MVVSATLIEQLTEAAERAPRGAVEAATRALAAAGDRGPAVRASFLTRGINALTTLATAVDERALGEAVGAESDLLALVGVLEQPDAATALRQENPLLPAILRGLRDRERLLAAEGGTVSAPAVAELLGITRQAVDKRRRSGTLLGLPTGRRGYAYPVWQFADGGTLPGLTEVLTALAWAGPWTQTMFLLNHNVWLDERRPLDELRRGRLDTAVEAAHLYGEQVAA